MGTIRVNGSTSGYVELAAPAVAGSTVLTLPATTGTVAVQGEAYGRSATATVATSQTTTSTSYTDLATAGPAVTLTTGTKALVVFNLLDYSSSTGTVYASVAISGATTLAVSDDWGTRFDSSLANYGATQSRSVLFTGLTAGSNTFTMKYKVSSVTGTFQARSIVVIDMGS
jgi:hypothetical protein